MAIKFKKKSESVIANVQVTTMEEDSFVSQAPVDKDTLKKVYDYEEAYTDKLTTEAVDVAIAAFKDGKVKKTELTAPFRLDETITATAYRDDGGGTPKLVVVEERTNNLQENFKKAEERMAKSLKDTVSKKETVDA
jgi:hypothetical protein